VEGLANRLVPVDFSKMNCPSTDPYGRQGRVQKDICYDLLMHSFRYRNLSDTTMYLDDHIRRTIVGNMSSMIFRVANAFADEMECKQNQNRGMEAMKKQDPTKADSLDKLISINKKDIAEWKKKAADLLTMADDSISDAARGNDPIFPMFAATAWERLDNREKAASNFLKVLKKAEAWVEYYEKTEIKLPEYDRLLSAVPFVLQRAESMKDYATAARAAEIAFSDSKEPQYQSMAEEFKKKAEAAGEPKTGTPQELTAPATKDSDSIQQVVE
jgi:hypothetical protein